MNSNTKDISINWFLSFTLSFLPLGLRPEIRNERASRSFLLFPPLIDLSLGPSHIVQHLERCHSVLDTSHNEVIKLTL